MAFDFSFTDEQLEFRDIVADLAQREIAPYVSEWDRKEVMPWHSINKMGEAGLLGIIGKPELGGLDLDYITLGIAVEEIAKVDNSSAMICSMQNTLTRLTPGWGDDFIAKVYAGKALVCIATSERDAGSDVSNIQTKAVVDGDELVITGEKIHVSLMPGATLMGVTAQIIENGESKGTEFLRVPADAPGVSCELMPEMGVRSHQLGIVRMKDVRIPRDAVLGDAAKGAGKGAGKAVLYARWNVSRCLSALNALGSAQAVLDQAIEFVKTKEVYGRKIGLNQAIQFPIVEHYTRVEACRLLAYKALWMNVRGENAAKEATMAKWHAVTLSVQAIQDCLQMFGANGYLTEFGIERRLRDTMGLMFTGGAINIMKMIVVKELFGNEFMGISRNS